jgi:hypothetical protein
MKKILVAAFLCVCCIHLWAQFPPQAPEPGNDAVAKDDSRIVGWAIGCTVERGWQNMMDTTLGKTTSGTESSVIGSPDVNVLSLGDGGSAIVTFAAPIKDGSGADFAVFENGFANPLDGYQAYLEFAFVSVSSDGIHYVTFPATSLTQDTAQIDNFTYMDARLVNNLAGKYANGYGTPFDLSELADSPNLDLQHIRFVKITDVVGSLDPKYARYDQDGRVINDPFPSPYPTGGFDLNAIAVLNQQQTGIADHSIAKEWKLWPLPATDFIFLKNYADQNFSYHLYSADGRLIKSGKGSGLISIDLKSFSSGIYFLKCLDEKGNIQTLRWNKW